MRDDFLDKIRVHLQWSPSQGDDRLRFLVLAMCGEVGELANLVKKDWRGDEGDRKSEIVKELADVAGNAYLLAAHLGVDLDQVVYDKILEVEERPKFKEWRARNAG